MNMTFIRSLIAKPREIRAIVPRGTTEQPGGATKSTETLAECHRRRLSRWVWLASTVIALLSTTASTDEPDYLGRGTAASATAIIVEDIDTGQIVHVELEGVIGPEPTAVCHTRYKDLPCVDLAMQVLSGIIGLYPVEVRIDAHGAGVAIGQVCLWVPEAGCLSLNRMLVRSGMAFAGSPELFQAESGGSLPNACFTRHAWHAGGMGAAFLCVMLAAPAQRTRARAADA